MTTKLIHARAVSIARISALAAAIAMCGAQMAYAAPPSSLVV
jgi:hypothetical protein